MNFCAIGPLATADIFKHHSHHMALAQYLYDEDYFNFMVSRKLEGKFVVLDSGVYENAAVDNRQLLYWCEKLGPSAVVLPDKPHDQAETLKRSLAFAQLLDNSGLQHIGKWKVLHAAKGELSQFTQSYIYDSRLFDGVCFSRLTESYGSAIVSGADCSRVNFIKYLKEQRFWNPSAYHHALGMLNGSTNELSQLRDAEINSCDSSAPIWRPLNQGYGLQDKPSSFNIPFDPFWNSVPSNNLEVADRIFKEVVKLCA